MENGCSSTRLKNKRLSSTTEKLGVGVGVELMEGVNRNLFLRHSVHMETVVLGKVRDAGHSRR